MDVWQHLMEYWQNIEGEYKLIIGIISTIISALIGGLSYKSISHRKKKNTIKAEQGSIYIKGSNFYQGSSKGPVEQSDAHYRENTDSGK